MKDNCSFYKDKIHNGQVVQSLYQVHEQKGYSMDPPDFKIGQHKTVFLQFQGVSAFVANKRIKFRHDEEINNSTIRAIELLSPQNMELALTQPATDLPVNEYKKGYLVLVDDCDFEFVKLPLTCLCKELNGNQLAMFNCPKVNWGACYVKFGQGAGLSASNSLQFIVHT